MKNILAILFIVASAGLFYVYIDPNYKEIKELLVQRSEFDEALNNSKKVQALRNELLNKFNSFAQADINRLEKLLPNNVDNIRLIIEIDRVASRYNMILRNVSISRSETGNNNTRSGNVILEKEPFGTVRLGFSVTGNYQEFKSFLTDIEKSLRIIDVVALDFEAKENTEEAVNITGQRLPDRYEYSLEINTYWLKSS